MQPAVGNFVRPMSHARLHRAIFVAQSYRATESCRPTQPRMLPRMLQLQQIAATKLASVPPFPFYDPLSQTERAIVKLFLFLISELLN